MKFAATMMNMMMPMCMCNIPPDGWLEDESNSSGRTYRNCWGGCIEEMPASPVFLPGRFRERKGKRHEQRSTPADA